MMASVTKNEQENPITHILTLTDEQRVEIQESRKEIEHRLFLEQVELDKEFNQWLRAR